MGKENNQPLTSRRELLAGTAVAGSLLLAGCGGKLSEIKSEEDLQKEVPAPHVSQDGLQGWDKVESFAQKYPVDVPVVDVTGIGHGVRYEDKKFREQVKSETLGRVDQSLAQFFAVRIDIFPEVAHLGSGLADIQETVENNFEELLQGEQFLQNISRDGVVETVTTDTNQEVDLVGYSAEYPVEEIVIEDLTIPDVGERTFRIEAQNLQVQGLIGHWKHNESIYVAGGVYPNEDFVASPRTSVSVGEGNGIDIIIDVNIELDQERQKVLNLIRSVQ